jgi:hypothetical protein
MSVVVYGDSCELTSLRPDTGLSDSSRERIGDSSAQQLAPAPRAQTVAGTASSEQRAAVGADAAGCASWHSDGR